jgi:hypothetical protein
MLHWWNRYMVQYEGSIGWAILGLFLAALAWGIWQWKRNNAHSAAQAATT